MKKTVAIVLGCLMSVGIASTAAAATYSFTTSTGASLIPGVTDIGNHTDDGTTTIVLPFPFVLYGTTYTSANVSSNGNLQFLSNNSAFINTALPATGFSDTIFGFWDDLETTGTGHGVFRTVTGVAPNRTFVIEWRTQYFNNNTATANFEIVLREGQTSFDVIYGQIDNNNSATIGVQDLAADFTQVSFNGSGTLATSGLDITFSASPVAAPEPGTLILLGIGLVGVSRTAWKRRKKSR